MWGGEVGGRRNYDGIARMQGEHNSSKQHSDGGTAAVGRAAVILLEDTIYCLHCGAIKGCSLRFNLFWQFEISVGKEEDKVDPDALRKKECRWEII